MIRGPSKQASRLGYRFRSEFPAKICRACRAEAEKLKQIFREIPIAARVRDDWGEPSAREVVHVDADRANMAHVTNADVSDSIDAALHGITAGVLRDGNKQIPIVGRMRMEERAQLSDLRSLYVFSRQDTPPVPLDQVATISLDPVTPKIRRFDQYRTITVQCWPAEGHLPSEVISAAMPKLKEFQKQLPDGFIFRFAGEQKEQVSGFGDLTTVLVICVCAIYLALLAQFKHAFKPLIVFAAIPYGVVGAIFSLAIMGQPFGFMAFLGIISLIGVIVSHIIVLFEFIEERREAGEELELALIDAGILRLRPVMITVAATVIALFPLAAHGGPLWEPLCYAQIGGLTIATFVTLGLVPVLYSFVVLDLKLIRWEQAEHTGFGRFGETGRDACNIGGACVTAMNIGHIIQYATLLSLLMGGLGVVVAVLNHREQVKTQIFLAMSAQYDELLKNSSAEFWLSVPPGTELPERTDDLTISMLRFCTLVSLTYLLFCERRIPKRMWELMLRSAERRFRSPLFVREWEHLRTEFESFPEFVSLVASVHRMSSRIETAAPSVIQNRGFAGSVSQ